MCNISQLSSPQGHRYEPNGALRSVFSTTWRVSATIVLGMQRWRPGGRRRRGPWQPWGPEGGRRGWGIHQLLGPRHHPLLGAVFTSGGWWPWSRTNCSEVAPTKHSLWVISHVLTFYCSWRGDPGSGGNWMGLTQHKVSSQSKHKRALWPCNHVSLLKPACGYRVQAGASCQTPCVFWASHVWWLFWESSWAMLQQWDMTAKTGVNYGKFIQSCKTICN